MIVPLGLKSGGTRPLSPGGYATGIVPRLVLRASL